MYPMFFSVSGKDISFADSTWEAFPDDWIYLYSKTGRLGVRFRNYRRQKFSSSSGRKTIQSAMAVSAKSSRQLRFTVLVC